MLHQFIQPLSIALIFFILIVWASAALDFTIDEEVPIGTVVGNVKVRYFDVYGIKTQGKAFRLLQTSKRNRGLFDVNQSTGVISVKQRIDRDKMCSSNLVCRVEFSVYLDSPTDSKVDIAILINDINDCAPRWLIRPSSDDAIRVDFRDGDSPGRSVAVQSAVDGDLGRNGSVEYTLNNFGAPFHLRHSREDGKLFLEAAKVIDREERDSYTMTLSANDDGTPPLSGSVRLLVRVTDVNDNAPQFATQLFAPTRPIYEDEPVSGLVLTLNATDKDSGAFGTVVYDFANIAGHSQDTARHLFSVTPDGRVVVKRRLDYDRMAEKSVIFEVIARDDARDLEGRLTATATVSIAVLDRIDEAPSIEVCYLPAGCGGDHGGGVGGASASGTSTSVPENLTVGTRVAMVIVHDPDTGDKVDCAAGPNGDQGRGGSVAFELHRASHGAAGDGLDSRSPWTFDLVVKRPLDRESQRQVCYRIVCTDSARHSAERALCVDVSDVNDNPPAPNPSVVEPIRVHAREEDRQKQAISRLSDFIRDADSGQNAALNFALDSADDDASSFAIDASSGVLRPSIVLDREVRAEYRFRVVVSDKGENPLSATVSLKVIVDDVNDNPPVCPRAEFRMQVAENLAAGAVVGRVEATDPDSVADGNGRVAFRAAKMFGGGLLSAPGASSIGLKNSQLRDWDAFVIDTATGEIRTALPLDRETKSLYSLPVIAEDQPKSGIPKLSATCHVTVTIEDANDNKPEFRISPPDLPDSFQVTLREPGQSIGRVLAEDKDEGVNGQVEYELLNSADIGDRFAVDRQSGLVLISRSLNAPLPPSESHRQDGSSRNSPASAATAVRQPVEFLLRVKACDRGRPSQCSQTVEFKAVLATSDAAPNYRGRSGGFGGGGGGSGGGVLGPSGTGNSGGHGNNGVAYGGLSNEVAIACLIVTFFVLVIACGAVVCLIIRRRSGAAASDTAMCPTIVTASAAIASDAAVGADGTAPVLVESRELDEAALESELDNPRAKMMPSYSSYYKDYREDYGTYNSTLHLKQSANPHMNKLRPATVARDCGGYYSTSTGIGRLLLSGANSCSQTQPHYQTLDQNHLQQMPPTAAPSSNQNQVQYCGFYEIHQPMKPGSQRSRSLPRGNGAAATESAGLCVDGKQQQQQQQQQQLQQLSRSIQQSRGPFSPYTEASFV